MNEQWIPVFDKEIPKGKYECCLKNGEEGLIICLTNQKNEITLDFGAVIGLRMFDKGMLLNDWPPLNIATQTDYFGNTIYKILEGNFLKDIRNLSGKLYCGCELNHFVVVSMNYFIEIVSRWEPDIIIK